MFSILFLASVVDATTHLSLPENFRTTTQKLSSQLRTTALTYARRHTRRLQDTSACAWDNGKCTLSPNFIASSTAMDEHDPIKQLATKSVECSAVKQQATCTGDCAYKSGKCDVSEKVSGELLQSILEDGSDSCGNLSAMMQGDECTSITSETACTDKCEWHKSGFGYYEIDVADNMCKEVPECKKKGDPKDPYGLNKLCPNMEVVKAECEAKEDDKAKWECYGDKCPILLMFFGGMACNSSPTEDKCKNYGDMCAWKDTNKCELNMNFVLDRLAPEGCWLRPMLEESFVCGQEKSATTCAGTAKCEWQNKTECEGAGAPKMKQECAGSGQSMMIALLGDHAARQQDACQKATTMSTCTSVEAMPDDTLPNTGDEKLSSTGATSAILTVLTVFAGVLAA